MSATDASGVFDGQFSEAALDSLRGDPTGRAETFPIQRDGLVPVCFFAEDGARFSVMLDLEPEQAERLASMLVEQATAAREQREEQPDE